MSTTPQSILSFWFSDAIEPKHFIKDPDFDAQIRQRFASTYAAAQRGALDDWQQSAEGALALIIVLDQFPRNMFRNQPKSFATDAKALAVAKQAIANEFDASLSSKQCVFLYMPMMHSEQLAIQEASVALYKQLGQTNLSFAIAHYDIIAKFGRFPHRNSILGRTSTAEEHAFLQQPHSSF